MVHALAVFGISGRMGRSIVKALPEHPLLYLSGAGASPASATLGQALTREVRIASDPKSVLVGAAVALDFSSGESVAAHAEACALAGVPVLVGATGFDAAARLRLEQCAARCAVLLAPNTSVGVSVLLKLTALAAAALTEGVDIEIFETHHRDKPDAPSGTALALGEAAAAGRGRSLGELRAPARTGGVRRSGSIGFAAARGGDVVGEHTVGFFGDGERLELTHRVTDRMIFARGALRAAEWLVGRGPGLYRMQDVLGLK